MSLIATRNSDPAAVVSKSAAAKTTMWALDAELVHTFDMPASGAVLVRIAVPVSGAATFPQILLGVRRNNANTIVRVPAKITVSHPAASSIGVAEALFAVYNMEPGLSTTWWASYSVVEPVAGSFIRWGGPDDGVGPAYGAATFEIWSA